MRRYWELFLGVLFLCMGGYAIFRVVSQFVASGNSAQNVAPRLGFLKDRVRYVIPKNLLVGEITCKDKCLVVEQISKPIISGCVLARMKIEFQSEQKVVLRKIGGVARDSRLAEFAQGEGYILGASLVADLDGIPYDWRISCSQWIRVGNAML